MHTVTGSAFISSQQNMALTGARLAKDAQLLIDAGFISGSTVGPTIYSSNSIISPTGGHADLHTMPKAWFEDACSHGLPMRTCDGVAECLKAVREQLRTGAKVIKICGSGGVGSERDNPVDQQFSADEMGVMVEEATRAQRLVGAQLPRQSRHHGRAARRRQDESSTAATSTPKQRS
ncbi:hypothetical protein KC354_g9908 [Hortaea werneckii]|nr:hypothetical protein KC354_g9908 [Hortaea werneckii]